MKNYFTLLLILIISTSISAQDLPNIPIKNGMAYYSFEHKLNNTAKCLSSYIDGNIQRLGGITSVQQKLMALSQKTQKEDNSIQVYQLLLTRKMIDLKCVDTFKSGPADIAILLKPNYYVPMGLISFVKRKVVTEKITASISIVFISKNEYILKIKDIVYNVAWMQGKNSGNDIYNIGESYENAKKDEKVKKDDVKFYAFIDAIIKTTDKIILSAITDTYKSDEL